MIRYILAFLVLGGTTAMAAPKDVPNYNPLTQIPTSDGKVRDQNAPPSDGEIALQMWRKYMGDKPMPQNLRQKYGIPDNAFAPDQ